MQAVTMRNGGRINITATNSDPIRGGTCEYFPRYPDTIAVSTRTGYDPYLYYQPPPEQEFFEIDAIEALEEVLSRTPRMAFPRKVIPWFKQPGIRQSRVER